MRIQNIRLLLNILKTTGNQTCKSPLSTSSFKGKYSTKVPQQPVDSDVCSGDASVEKQIDLEWVKALEKLSLVDFANKEGLLRLQAAISMADQLSEVDTEGVEPIYTVLENRSMALADDEVLVENISEEILGCAKETLEDYFVVPPGNIDYIPDEKYYDKLKEEENTKLKKKGEKT